MAFSVISDEIVFSTKNKEHVVNLTEKVEKIVEKGDIKNGICQLFAPHATGILVINENESGIKKDYIKGLNDIVPENNNWSHDRIDNNAHSHIKSAFVGSDKTIPVTNGKLDLGTWQDIFFIETDGPRSGRKIKIKVLGET